ncbi:neurexin-4-like isoform X2 [Diaphorina citri]|uniref:Neurexin-4-like isoform X2 n=1 Tax=Diaphorina citri TaxID=121845 RepID=A0A1S4EHX6_DIACI|nr:neurexin-4-like isoform X2 [Diaphorina citri]
MRNLSSLYLFCVYSLIQLVLVNSESDYYDCNEPLLDRASIKATSQLPDREAHNARLNGMYHTYIADSKPTVYGQMKLLEDM